MNLLVILLTLLLVPRLTSAVELYPFNNGEELTDYINGKGDLNYDVYIRTATLAAFTTATHGLITKEMTQALGLQHAGLEFRGDKGTIINVQKFIATYEAAIYPTSSNAMSFKTEAGMFAPKEYCANCDAKNIFGYNLEADDSYWHPIPEKSGTIKKESLLEFVKFLNGEQFTKTYNLFEVTLGTDEKNAVTFPRQICYNVVTRGLHYFDVENAFINNSKKIVTVHATILGIKGDVRSVVIDPSTHDGYKKQIDLIMKIIKVLPEGYKMAGKIVLPDLPDEKLSFEDLFKLLACMDETKCDYVKILTSFGIDVAKLKKAAGGNQLLGKFQALVKDLRAFWNKGSFYWIYNMPNEKYLGKYDGTKQSNLNLRKFGSDDGIVPKERYQVYVFEFDFTTVTVDSIDIADKWFDQYKPTPKPKKMTFHLKLKVEKGKSCKYIKEGVEKSAADVLGIAVSKVKVELSDTKCSGRRRLLTDDSDSMTATVTIEGTFETKEDVQEKISAAPFMQNLKGVEFQSVTPGPTSKALQKSLAVLIILFVAGF